MIDCLRCKCHAEIWRDDKNVRANVLNIEKFIVLSHNKIFRDDFSAAVGFILSDTLSMIC